MLELGKEEADAAGVLESKQGHIPRYIRESDRGGISCFEACGSTYAPSLFLLEVVCRNKITCTHRDRSTGKEQSLERTSIQCKTSVVARTT